jgi:hypothetical protein
MHQTYKNFYAANGTWSTGPSMLLPRVGYALNAVGDTLGKREAWNLTLSYLLAVFPDLAVFKPCFLKIVLR